MIDVDKIRDLVELMGEHDLTELSLRDGEVRILLKRGQNNSESPVVHVSPAPLPVTEPAGPNQQAPVQPPATAGPESAEDDGPKTIDSPMVGTFYTASDPDLPPFVKVGDTVGPDTVVCIIEAMKVFNEIKAEVSGVVEKVMVSNQEAIEFGQPLFAIRPA